MKRLICAALIAGAAVVARAEDLPGFPFVFATGHAKTEVAPDLARVSFTIKVFHETSSNAVVLLAGRSQTVLGFLADQKIKEEDITAHEVEKDSVREQKDNHDLRILGYNVQRRIAVTIRDLTTFDAITQCLLTSDSVEGVETSFDRTDRQKIEEDLVAKACKDAREQADRLAKGFGTEVATVFAISERGFSNLGKEFGVHGDAYYTFLPTSSEARVARLLFVPSTITLRQYVTAIFRLKGKE